MGYRNCTLDALKMARESLDKAYKAMLVNSELPEDERAPEKGKPRLDEAVLFIGETQQELGAALKEIAEGAL